MRRVLGLAALALLALPASALGVGGEPVSVVAKGPAAVVTGVHFRLAVSVAADAGALDIAAQPLRLRVRLAAECGGSFAGTRGPTAIDRTLPPPVVGAPYAANVIARPRAPKRGTMTVCAFLEDAQKRQFATDTEETVRVVPRCEAANRRLIAIERALRRVRARLAKARKWPHLAGLHAGHGHWADDGGNRDLPPP